MRVEREAEEAAEAEAEAPLRLRPRSDAERRAAGIESEAVDEPRSRRR